MDIVVYREGLDTLGFQGTLESLALQVTQALKEYLDIQELGVIRVTVDILGTQGRKQHQGTRELPVTPDSLDTAEMMEFLGIVGKEEIRGIRVILEYMERLATLVALE